MRYIIVRVGKKYFKMDIILLIAEAMKLSKTEIKRLIKDKAVEVYLQ